MPNDRVSVLVGLDVRNAELVVSCGEYAVVVFAGTDVPIVVKSADVWLKEARALREALGRIAVRKQRLTQAQEQLEQRFVAVMSPPRLVS